VRIAGSSPASTRRPQSCKVVIADPDSGDIIRTGSAPHPPGTEVDPEAWWTALHEAIAAAGGLDDVAGLSISGQQHGLVALDSEGRVIRDALLWNDLRSKAAARDLIAEVGGCRLCRTHRDPARRPHSPPPNCGGCAMPNRTTPPGSPPSPCPMTG
jgi:sugar (pentulose or hexulose) kinase